MIDKNKRIVGFVLLDPLARIESFVTDDDPELLNEAVKSGMVLMVQYDDETRDFVTPDEVSLSTNENSMTINIVQQEVFVPIMEALLDLMADSMKPAVALLSVTGDRQNVSTKYDVFRERVEDMLERYRPNLTDEGGEDVQ